MSSVRKKHLKLVDRRAVSGGIVRELRRAIKEIESGDIVSMAFVYVRRDKTFAMKFDCESPLTTLGAVDTLKDAIKEHIQYT